MESTRAAITHSQFSPEQYIRPKCSAVAHGINHRLAFNYQQFIWQPFSFDYSYVKSCYDQIVYSAASLNLQHLGIPLP